MLLSKVALVLLSLLIASCGFKPLYQGDIGGIKNELSSVCIEKGQDREARKFHYYLLDKINPYNKIDSKCKYSLSYKLLKASSSAAILRDSQATRRKIRMTVEYSLKDNTADRVINQGDISHSNSFDISPSNEFSNYTSEAYLTDNIINELSKELVMRLSAILVKARKS